MAERSVIVNSVSKSHAMTGWLLGWTVAPAPVTDEEKEAAARAAGFENLADISFYLRSLISGHHDTLAVKVK